MQPANHLCAAEREKMSVTSHIIDTQNTQQSSNLSGFPAISRNSRTLRYSYRSIPWPVATKFGSIRACPLQSLSPF